MSSDAQTKHETTTLVRQLGLWSAVFMCMGSEIGSGVFLVSSDIAQSIPSPLIGILVWVAAGALSLAGALIFAELGTMFPKAGGQYVFLRESFHPILAFLYGWTNIFVIQSGTIAALAVGFVTFCGPYIGFEGVQKNLVASAIIIVLTIMNFAGIKKGAKILDAVTSFKIVAILALIVYILFFSKSGNVSPIELSTNGATFSAFGVALLSAFWGFDGWYSITFVAGEMKDPARDIPKASWISIAGTTVIYAIVSYCIYKVLPVAEIAKSTFVGADAVKAVGGDSAVKIIGILVIVSVVGCLNATIISSARVIYAMAIDGVMPHSLAVVNPKTHSPNRALTLQAFWSILLVWSGTYDQLYTYVIFAGFIFYGFTAAAVLWLRRKKPTLDRPYKVALYPVLPILYVLFTIALTINTLSQKPKESLAGLCIVATGWPAFYIMKRLSARGKATQS